MSHRKPRSDSKLKGLPDEKQVEIIDLLKAKSLRDAAAELRQAGIATSRSALGEFWDWWHWREQFKRHESDAEEFMAQIRQQDPSLAEAKVQEFGAAFFQLQAVKNQDAKTFVQLASARHRAKMDVARLDFDRSKHERDSRIREESLQLDVAKYQRETCEMFIRWAEDERAKQIATGASSNDEKIETLGQLMFGEAWRATRPKDPQPGEATPA